MKKLLYTLLLLLGALPLLTACKDDDDTPEATEAAALQVTFEHVVGDDPLQLYEKTYTSPAGDSFVVQNFKYYISNVKLIGSKGQHNFIEPESYHLIEQGGKTSFELKDIPAGTYTQLELSIGVDQEHNHKIDHQGDLDPSNEMVWDWDTGYKFLLLVGTYTADTKSGGLVYHVGGDVNYRTLTLDLPQPLQLQPGQKPTMRIKADVEELLQHPHLIDFDELNSTGHGPTPSKLADNYSNGFLKVVEVK